MAQMTHAEIKDKMIWAGKVLVNEGQDDFTRGHISFRLPDNPKLFFMKCHSVGLDEIIVRRAEGSGGRVGRAGRAGR